jgi:hypothetical protein
VFRTVSLGSETRNCESVGVKLSLCVDLVTVSVCC